MGIAEHRKRFDEAAYQYHSDRYPGRGNCARLVLDFLEPSPDDIILDVGCGPGEQLALLAPNIREGYGIDLSGEMINRASEANRGCSHLHFYVGSANQIPEDLKEVRFTKIFTNYTLHHLPTEEKTRAIRGLSNCLRPGGRLVMGDLMFSDDPDKYESLFEYVGYGPGSDTPSKISELEKAFDEAGFTYTTRIMNPLVGLIVGNKVA